MKKIMVIVLVAIVFSISGCKCGKKQDNNFDRLKSGEQKVL